MFGRTAGFDIGSSAVHIAVRSKNGIERFVSESLPDCLAGTEAGRFGAEMSAFLKETCKKHGLRFDSASVLIPQSACLCRRLCVPSMTHAQMRVNIPYELRGFCGGDCIYDYSVIGDAGGGKMWVMAAAAQKSVVYAIKDVFRRAGIRLSAAMPAESAYANFGCIASGSRRCIADIGHSAVRLYMYAEDGYEMTHVIDGGCQEAARAFGDGKGAPSEDCLELCRKLAAGIRNPVYFLGYSHPESVPDSICLIGGGAQITPLKEALDDALPIKTSDSLEMFGISGADRCIGAVGAVMQRGDINEKI